MAQDTKTDQSEYRFKPYRPERSVKLPPCRANCPSGTHVRDWIAEIAQGPRNEADRHGAYERAWRLLVQSNPFPATMGRICPHPCEDQCNRGEKDGAVAVSALERFLGDWAIEQGCSLPVAATAYREESIGVIGAGPAGMSFAYQMCRLGYPVTVYERHALPGGMLRYGVPEYRLPRRILDAELNRIFDLGVVLIAPVRIGVDIRIAELQSRHRVLFLGLGAQHGRRLGIPGEHGEHVWSGVDFLERVNRGTPPPLGDHVIVVGGGNTAIDAARIARRSGASVTLLYRRCREDMPAIGEEVDAAVEEGVAIDFLTTPISLIHSDTGTLTGVRVQRLQVEGSDQHGRSKVKPLPGSARVLLASTLITAVSQEPDWTGCEALSKVPGTGPQGLLQVQDGPILTAGGDLTGLDLASHAIGQGRAAAEAVHAQLRGLTSASSPPGAAARVQPDHYPAADRVRLPLAPVARRLADLRQESSSTIDEESFLREVSRCFSCGLCNGCSLCWMYCGGGGFIRLESSRPGHYFAFSTDECTGCGKCIELCPTGYVSQAL